MVLSLRRTYEISYSPRYHSNCAVSSTYAPQAQTSLMPLRSSHGRVLLIRFHKVNIGRSSLRLGSYILFPFSSWLAPTAISLVGIPSRKTSGARPLPHGLYRILYRIFADLSMGLAGFYRFFSRKNSRLQNSSKRETGRFLKKAPQKLLKWFYLDIVTAIPCATKYRNCKTPEIVERVRRDPTLLTTERFQVLDFVFSEFCNRLSAETFPGIPSAAVTFPRRAL